MRAGIPLSIVILSMITMPIVAQTPFQVCPVRAQTRDAVIHLPTGTVLLAVYDRNEVWQVDPVTQERLAAAPVGGGPASLALSADNRVLACVNHLDCSVSLIRVADMASYATVACGKGACAVCGLPGGSFAVANSFTDSLTFIDPARPEETESLEHVIAVPKGVAASESFLGVITCAPPALHLFLYGSQSPAGTVPMDAPPTAVAALDLDHFAVATRVGVLVVDGSRAAVVARNSQRVKDLASDGGRLFALTGGTVDVVDRFLDRIETLELAEPGCAVAAGAGLVAVLSPKNKAWQVHGALPHGLRVSAEAPKTETAAVLPARPESKHDRRSAGTQAPPGGGKTMAKDARVPGKAYGRIPLGTVETHAPRLGRRPSPSVLEVPSERTIFDALTQSYDLGPVEGGFEPPDWTQPLRDIEGDELEGRLGTDEFSAHGNVRLRLDTLNFSAEEFSYSQGTGEMQARDDVLITQGRARLSAEEFYYRIPNESELPPPSLVEADLDEQQQAKRRLSLGAVDIKNLHLREPMRELTAERLQYDPAAQTGEVLRTRGHTDIYYFSADKLRILGPGSADGEDVWVTTCDRDPPHYKIRLKHISVRDGRVTLGKHARLQLGRVPTPAYWPRWRFRGEGQSLDFDSGHRAEIGYFVNVGQQFPITPDVTLGLRLFPTTKEGVGVGLESDYDFMESPTSPLFRGKGEIHTLYTTEDRGHLELYHRHEVTEDAVLLLQAEQWFDRDFYKDFYYDRYRNRAEPRTFANLTLTKPAYIASATVRKDTHDFVRETERLPEVTYHLLERRLVNNLYFTFDTVDGYIERQSTGPHATRLSNIGRLTLDLDWNEALSLTPFLEVEGTWYSNERRSSDAAFRCANTIGTTLQTRFHKAYPGGLGFSGFKHIVVPSVTYSYRPEPTMDVEKTPRFDAVDNVYGRSRIESKIDNVLFGRDAETGEVWQVARLTLYQGNDFWNENRKAADYELEFDVRPRPWWGWQVIGERHIIADEIDLDEPFFIPGAVRPGSRPSPGLGKCLSIRRALWRLRSIAIVPLLR